MTEAVHAPRASMPNPLAGLDPRRRQMVILAIVLVTALVYPLLYRYLANAPVLGFIPWPGTAVLIFCATFAILALGLNIVMGFAGLLEYQWQSILVEGRRFDRAEAKETAIAYLAGNFPREFSAYLQTGGRTDQ